MAIADVGFRALAYDRRGFGRSSKTWHGYDYDSLSDDLATVIEYMQAPDTIIVGFSMGDEVARYMSRHAGKSVANAVLISFVVPFRLKIADNPTGTEQTAFDETAQKIEDDRAKFSTSFFRTFFGTDTPGNLISEELLDSMRNIAMQVSLKATLAPHGLFATHREKLTHDLLSFIRQ